MKRLEAIIGRAYELAAQVLNGDELDLALAEEVSGECAELLAHVDGDMAAFESEEVMDGDLARTAMAMRLIDKATSIIYNIEGDLYQETYDKLEAILDTMNQAETRA